MHIVISLHSFELKTFDLNYINAPFKSCDWASIQTHQASMLELTNT